MNMVHGNRFALLAALATLGSLAWADPCGMVPPIWTGDGPAITRIGAQKTYVFHKGGLESFVIRPGFSGKVEQFGMLIPFPDPPAIRKVPDEIFSHLASAIDPEPVQLDLLMWEMSPMADGGGLAPSEGGLELRREEVRVLRQEAVGMYEVAVLEAGSAAALKRWMDQHGYRYPQGMDNVCEEYVESEWCFVAVKTRVGAKAGVTPRPGMRDADPSLPQNTTFAGQVQAMGFRFRSEELVVPMRLSAFNEGQLRNIVYVLAEEPLKIDRIDASLVRRQVSGGELYRNLTDPRPVLIRHDKVSEWFKLVDTPQAFGVAVLQAVSGDTWRQLSRDPDPVNGYARDLFAGDLLAARHDRLAHPYEEREKALLQIDEQLGLRDEQMDALRREATRTAQEQVLAGALRDVKQLTLTVIDGDFPREVISRANLSFSRFKMAPERNRRAYYDARGAQVRAGPSKRPDPWAGIQVRGITFPVPDLD